MVRKLLLIGLALVVAFSLASCGNKKAYSTDNVKKFVEKMKRKETMPDDKMKKALKSIFPKIKID